jgi:hypothetical protein
MEKKKIFQAIEKPKPEPILEPKAVEKPAIIIKESLFQRIKDWIKKGLNLIFH